MHHRFAGILTGAVALSLVASGIAVADSVSGDADLVVAGDQGLINLGTVAPGSSHQVQIAFDLLCTGSSHAAVNSTITLTPTVTPPTGGSISATPGTIGPVPLTWPAAGAPCVDDPVLRSSVPSTVSLTAPLTAGSNLIYRVTYTKAPTSGISGGTLVQIALSVDANAAPELDLPATMTVEADTTGGWMAAYTATATDAEDDPDPAADCTPAPGALLALGTTTVDCSATDTAGATATGSFAIHVVDTTPPQLGSMPAPTATTADPGGATVTYTTPGANDVVDPSPAVGCVPVSGSTFAAGTTTVTCTATDASGNSASASFPVVVTFVPPPTPTPTPTPSVEPTPTPSADPTPTPPVDPSPSADPSPSPSADPSPSPSPDPSPSPSSDPTPPAAPPVTGMGVSWDRPLGDGWTAARLGRTVPVKVGVQMGDKRLVPAAGRPVPTLRADHVSACRPNAGVTGSVALGAMRWHGGRWTDEVRTRQLGAGCWRLVVVVNGRDAGSAGLKLVDERHCGKRGHGGPIAG